MVFDWYNVSFEKQDINIKTVWNPRNKVYVNGEQVYPVVSEKNIEKAMKLINKRLSLMKWDQVMYGRFSMYVRSILKSIFW